MASIDYIEFLGTKSYDSVAKYMSDSDMFILPSVFDASPCVCYEAMASGTLTCGCSIYGPAELIKNNETGLLFEPYSPNSIAETIIFAMDNPETVKEIVLKGVDDSKSKTWDNSAKRLYNAYVDILK